jgi:hypothetical protein
MALRHYNYVDEIYFPNFSVIPSIDFITLGTNEDNLDIVDKILINNGFVSFNDKYLKKGKYEKMRLYRSIDDRVNINVIYDLKHKFLNMPNQLVTIHDPFRDLLDLLDVLFKRHGIESKMSKIEISFDFFTDKVYDLYEIIQSSLYLKYQKSNSFNVKTTYYTNNIRKSAKGMRQYVKSAGREKWVRVELVLARRKIKELEIEFPLTSFSDLDIFHFFEFKNLSMEKILKYLIWKNRGKINTIGDRSKKWENLLDRQIESWVNGCLCYPDSLMGKIEILKSKEKGIENFHRFLGPNERLNSEVVPKNWTMC